ncbi:MAG TPA: hypothetical protein VHU83_22990 [Bryobacteraceae bacterium]|jgi:hypothetical protein|nr:hypothetical protein [Bryobacteraceae bacterium]
MSPRSIRRAAERRQQKLLKQQNRALAMAVRPDEPAPLSEAKTQENEPVERQQQKLARKAAQQTTEISEARLAANRANAQLSTGPASVEGKAKSSLNAVKTGLTGRTVLLPGDDAALYEAHISHFMQRHQPANDEEHALVQSLADTEWRLMRIPSLEMGIYAVGRLECAAEFPQEHPDVRAHLIQAKIFLAYQRQLNNLSIQESRLRRQRDKDTAVLKQLQADRRARETACPTPAARPSLHLGFDFSTPEIDLPVGAASQPAPHPATREPLITQPLVQNAA